VNALLVQVPARQLPVGHNVSSALLVVPTHTPVAGLHVPGLRQGPASGVQSRLLTLHKSAGCRATQTYAFMRDHALVSCCCLLPGVMSSSRQASYQRTHECNRSNRFFNASLVQTPATQLPDGHVVPSVLSVAPSHTPVAGLHVPGLRQGPACAVQLTLLAVHKSVGHNRHKRFTCQLC
jgi:hypothetical protein